MLDTTKLAMTVGRFERLVEEHAELTEQLTRCAFVGCTERSTKTSFRCAEHTINPDSNPYMTNSSNAKPTRIGNIGGL